MTTHMTTEERVLRQNRDLLLRLQRKRDLTIAEVNALAEIDRRLDELAKRKP